LISHPLKKQPT